MQMVYQHMFIYFGNISISFLFTGLFFRTEIFRPILHMSALVTQTYQLAFKTVEVFFEDNDFYVSGDEVR
jgi:hypothetical protein